MTIQVMTTITEAAEEEVAVEEEEEMMVHSAIDLKEVPLT